MVIFDYCIGPLIGTPGVSCVLLIVSWSWCCVFVYTDSFSLFSSRGSLLLGSLFLLLSAVGGSIIPCL